MIKRKTKKRKPTYAGKVIGRLEENILLVRVPKSCKLTKGRYIKMQVV